MPNFTRYSSEGKNLFTIWLFGEEMGSVESKEEAEELISSVREELASNQSNLYMVEDLHEELIGEESIYKQVDETDKVYEKIKRAFKAHQKETLTRAYMVKVNNTTVNLANAGDVDELLTRAIDKYDENDEYEVKTEINQERIMSTLTARLSRRDVEYDQVTFEAGAGNAFGKDIAESELIEYMDFKDITQGITNIGFAEEVEVAETYIPRSEIVDVDTALSLFTEMQEIQQIYDVQPGDTLSAISGKVGISMEELVELNSEYLKDVNSTIRAGQSLIITVPEPELSILWTRREIVEESYEAPIVYIDNDDWYTTKSVVLTEPSAGFRKIVSDVTYKNDNLINKNIIKEEILLEAVAKVVERGTKVPPTFIKPISGGKVSSGFGPRSSPGGIGSRNHQGVDFAIPIGSTVMASSGGTVSAAGWSGGYGYMVLITHPDGSKTRYAHLSKVLVSVGQRVSQGEKIALSGSTGISTGPHLHFEIIINGTPVNPMNYIN
ncbi:MAG: M23 family metallopeptidase [Lachnospiraceae bacterium]|nr:M23 family metallopeptidase [Lachnospiraceae bacterium]